MSLKAMFGLYLASTTVFILTALYVFPLLGAKPNPAGRDEILHVFHLERFFAADDKRGQPLGTVRAQGH